MPIPTYTAGYPPDGSSLGQTKAAIRNNLDGTFQTVAVDHVNNNGEPGGNPAGYHTVIHQVTQSGDPATVNGVNQVYSKTVSNDTALFMKSGLGVVQQLSGAFTAAAEGSVTLPGGIIMKWGEVAATIRSTGMVTFPIQFPNNCFNVQTSTSADSQSVTGFSGATIVAISKPSFTYTYDSDGQTSHFNGFYWFAIGN